MRRFLPLALLLGAALALAACGSSPSSTAGTTTSPGAGGGGTVGATVTITDAASPGKFEPATVTIKVGQTVQFADQSNTPHSVEWQAGGFPTSTTLNKGNSYTSPVFTTAGTFPYICGIHGASMSGTVVVQP